MFKQLFSTACYAGLAAALLLTLLQILWLTPMIVDAERYEVSEPSPVAAHQHSSAAGTHLHDHGKGWAPAEGAQRNLFSFISNLAAAVGFGLLLAALYHLRAPSAAWQGLLWGVAGYLVFFLAPSLGLPPELPGTEAAALEPRQAWWLLTCLTTALGLALMVFAQPWGWRMLGLACLVLPHLLGAPHPDEFNALAPMTLIKQFHFAVLVSNGIFWLLLGWVSAYCFTKLAPSQS